MNLIATGASSWTCRATHTDPIPPRASGRSRRYLPAITAPSVIWVIGLPLDRAAPRTPSLPPVLELRSPAIARGGTGGLALQGPAEGQEGEGVRDRPVLE